MERKNLLAADVLAKILRLTTGIHRTTSSVDWVIHGCLGFALAGPNTLSAALRTDELKMVSFLSMSK